MDNIEKDYVDQTCQSSLGKSINLTSGMELITEYKCPLNQLKCSRISVRKLVAVVTCPILKAQRDLTLICTCSSDLYANHTSRLSN